MIETFFNDILDKYSVSDSFAKEVREKYRNDLEESLSKNYSLTPKYRYGGSLSKGTANTNSCDIDLLCYLPSDETLSVEDIYKTAEESLRDSNYYFQSKNSAICVKGKNNEKPWEMTVDVVPGKYTSNEDNKDVYLWCNRDRCRLKSNPELQIEKVRNSDSKDVIRLIKLYRTFNSFIFKSFFLENFAIDVIEPEFVNEDSIMDKLVKFCKRWEDIGKLKIYDPANADNDIMTIHSEYEFSLIRERIHNLYEALMTNNEETIKKCFLGDSYSLDDAYIANAKSHSPLLHVKGGLIPFYISLRGYIVKENTLTSFSSNSIINKQEELKFIISIPSSIQVKDVKLVVSNAGYEAYKSKCPRGNAEDTKKESKDGFYSFYRFETTLYYGNHVVQALVHSTSGNTYLSDYLIVRVR